MVPFHMLDHPERVQDLGLAVGTHELGRLRRRRCHNMPDDLVVRVLVLDLASRGVDVNLVDVIAEEVGRVADEVAQLAHHPLGRVDKGHVPLDQGQPIAVDIAAQPAFKVVLAFMPKSVLTLGVLSSIRVTSYTFLPR